MYVILNLPAKKSLQWIQEHVSSRFNDRCNRFRNSYSLDLIIGVMDPRTSTYLVGLMISKSDLGTSIYQS
jgi:hypothetical protein